MNTKQIVICKTCIYVTNRSDENHHDDEEEKINYPAFENDSDFSGANFCTFLPQQCLVKNISVYKTTFN